jgi:hypothetical protein
VLGKEAGHGMRVLLLSMLRHLRIRFHWRASLALGYSVSLLAVRNAVPAAVGSTAEED